MPGRICIVGGGISGLAAAFRLAANHQHVILLEQSDELGGLGRTFVHNERSYERHYHCLLPSDHDLRKLISDIGCEESVYWRETAFAYRARQRYFPLNTPFELLRFSRLSLVDRIRVGLTALSLKRLSADGLDDIVMCDWLQRVGGKNAFREFWLPMLRAKFGEDYSSVPLLWLWTRFHREKGSKSEIKGYFRGGYGALARRIGDEIKRRGGEIRMDTTVCGINVSAAECSVSTRSSLEPIDCDAVILTTPYPVISELQFSRAEKLPPLPTVEFQGVINVVLFLNQTVTPGYYWVATVDENLPFQGVVETSHLIDSEARDAQTIIYLTRYLRASDSFYLQSDDAIRELFLNAFFAEFPDVSREALLASYVFRTSAVEPLTSVGYLSRRPPEEWIPGRIFLATTAQVYPDVASWNASVKLANAVVDRILHQ